MMKKIILVLTFIAAGSALAGEKVKLCDMFKYESENTICMKESLVPIIRPICEAHKNTDGSYTLKFCTFIDLTPSDGSVVLKDQFVDEFKNLCPSAGAVEEEEPGWFIESLRNFGDSQYRAFRH